MDLLAPFFVIINNDDDDDDADDENRPNATYVITADDEDVETSFSSCLKF